MTEIDWNKIHRNEFAHRCFLIPADYDYIGCRILYKNCCFDQFLYLAHQAIEKYLKAILLYNNVSSKNEKHDLERLLDKCLTIKHVQVSDDIKKFIIDFNGYDNTRYLTYNFSANSDFLIKTDKIVWQIRRYAQINYYDGRTSLFSGELEAIIKNDHNKHKKLKDGLIWKNFYYGKYKKRKILMRQRFWSKNTPLFMHHDKAKNKQCYEAVKDLVYLPSLVTKYFNS